MTLFRREPWMIAAALPEAQNRARMVQKDQTFRPRVLPAPVGGEVDFPDRDVFSLFALPELPAGTCALVLWHPGCGESRTPVPIPDRGDAHVAMEL